jgi:hypothetical protein
MFLDSYQSKYTNNNNKKKSILYVVINGGTWSQQRDLNSWTYLQIKHVPSFHFFNCISKKKKSAELFSGALGL